jgi:uncharacterized protein (TIGR03083 family)
MEIAEHVNALRREGEWLADAAERAGLDAPVPPCAPWQVKDLLRHTGYVHRWAARHITECPDQIIDGPSEEEILRGGADDARLLAWFRDGHAALAQTLATADPAVACATFMPAPSPLAFWARRQAHETAIHRADADSAAGTMPEYEADFAADGIDELIMGFGRRRKYQPGFERRRVPGCACSPRTPGMPGSSRRSRAASCHGATPTSRRKAGCTVSGPASGLYLYLWNRADAAPGRRHRTGDPGLLSSWQSSVRVRWGVTG